MLQPHVLTNCLFGFLYVHEKTITQELYMNKLNFRSFLTIMVNNLLEMKGSLSALRYIGDVDKISKMM